MPFFNEIVQLAINKDGPGMQALLDKGACIDERKKDKNFTTAAGYLAQLGYIDSAFWLINRFGAGPEFVILSLLKSSCIKEAQVLIDQYGTKENSLRGYFIEKNNHYSALSEKINQHYLRVLAHAGDMTSVDALWPKINFDDFEMNLMSIFQSNEEITREVVLKAAAFGGQIAYLEKKYAEQIPFPKHIGFELSGSHSEAGFGRQSYRFENEKLALHTLAFIRDDNFRQYLIDETSKHITSFNLKAVGKKASIIREIMLKFDIDFSQARKSVESANRKEAAEVIKTAQLVEHLHFRQDQAQAILRQPGLRLWFSKIQDSFAGEICAKEINHHINEFLIEGERNEDLSTSLKRMTQLPKLNHSSRMFSKSTPKPEFPPSVTRSGKRYKPY